MKYKTKTKYAEWVERAKSGKEKCAKCEETRNITIDHIVPIFILEQMCLDKNFLSYEMEDNFQFLCRYCNQQKSGRLDVRNPKTYEILYKVLREANDYFIQN